jgi:integrase/recombinase XerD
MNSFVTISKDARKDRQKKDGTFAVILRLSHFGKTTSIPTGISILEKDWDEGNRKIKSTFKGTETVSRLNNILQKKKADATDIILKLADEGVLNTLSLLELKAHIAPKNKIKPLPKAQNTVDLVLSLHKKGELAHITYKELKEKVYQTATAPSFVAFTKDKIALLHQSGKHGTALWHENMLAAVLSFHGKGDELTFDDLNYDFLVRFEAHHLGKGNNVNSLSSYLRSVRSLFNQAIKSGIVGRDLYPFENYQIKKQETAKRALEADDLQKIIALSIPPTHPRFHVRNYFLASYMLYGMNFIDLAALKKENIKNDRIQYRRNKTSKLYDIKIVPQLQDILSYYQSEHPQSPFLFPILASIGGKEAYETMRNKRRVFNSQLKKLAKDCGITANLSTYVTRHTFATRLLYQDVPLKAISQMLGHSSLKTTEIYLQSLPTSALDAYNNAILGE